MTAAAPFDTLPPAQQAGILCNTPQFQSFAATRIGKPGIALTPTAAAEYLRLACGVNSRTTLNTNPTAASRFHALRTDYDAWRGRIASPAADREIRGY